MHEHSKGHARQSFHVIGTWRFKNGGGGRGGGCSGGKQKDLVACKEVRIYWMLERCGGRDHADEEKCQTVLDQADRRHFGTKITEFLRPESTHKMIWAPRCFGSPSPALLVESEWLNSWEGRQLQWCHCRSPLFPSLCINSTKNNPTSRGIGTNVKSRTSTMATLACRWLPL